MYWHRNLELQQHVSFLSAITPGLEASLRRQRVGQDAVQMGDRGPPLQLVPDQLLGPGEVAGPQERESLE